MPLYHFRKRGDVDNKLTFLNSAVALKEQDKPDIKLYRKQMQTSATFLAPTIDWNKN